MKQDSDRRVHDRWELKDTIYGYLDGARFAAKSEDLSSGGLFIETKDEVPIGALISMVFRGQVETEDPPIFLIGRVMRRQKTPTQGIGLRWEKAVFTGPPAVLRSFLLDQLRLVDPTVVTMTGARGETKAVHHFSTTTPQTESAASGEVPDTIRRGDVTGGLGPVTKRLTKQSGMAPANVEAKISSEGEEEPIQLQSLGVKKMFTSAPPTLLIIPGAGVTVTISVRTRTGIAEVDCLCLVTTYDEGDEEKPEVLELEILDVREPKGHIGIHSRYVRWLHFNALTSA